MPVATRPAEAVEIGTVIDDERWPHAFRVGHVVVGPKWVTFRHSHPEANVYPNPPRRVRRGETVAVWL